MDGSFTPGLAALLIGLSGLAGGEGGNRILFGWYAARLKSNSSGGKQSAPRA